MRASLTIVLLLSPLLAQDRPPLDGVWHLPIPFTPPRPQPPLRRSSAAPVRTLILSALDASTRTANRRGDVPIGVERAANPSFLHDGLSWRAAVVSPGARAIRVRFSSFDSGPAAVRLTGESGEPVSYSGRGPHGDGAFWSADIPGDRVTIESDAAGDRPPFRVEAVAHLFKNLAADSNPQAAVCQLDYQCFPQWREPGQAVATISYQSEEDRSFYVCSGALLNTRSSSRTPYFLTANHCISTDSEARSLIAYWAYQTQSCNGAEPVRSQASRVEGARLLATESMVRGDWSLLLLNGLPTVPVFFAGWTTTEPSQASALTGIHHPGGSWKRITFGQRSADSSANVGGEFAPASQFYQMLQTEGRIEGGSSGSPLFDSAQRVTGVLSYGPVARPGGTVCDISPFRAGYGRFTSAYPAIRDYLDDTPPPVFTVSPASLAFTANNGVATPARADLTIVSQPAVSFTSESSASWLVLTNAAASIGVTVDPSKFFSSGRYSATITIRAGTAAPVNIPVTADVNAGASRVTARVFPDPVYERAPDSQDYRWFYDIRLTETAGVATRMTTFRFDGVDYSGSIAEFFGSGELAAFGSLNAGIRSRNLTVPSTRTFDFGGVDANGAAWTARATAQFLGPLQSAGLTVTVSPNPVVQNPASANCPWLHDVVVSETNGFPVTLTRWVAGGNDLSNDIAGWFGSTRVPANGSLRARLCWQGIVIPATLTFELGGRDDRGNTAAATADARFTGVPSEESTAWVAPERVVLRDAPGGTTNLRSVLNVRVPDGAAWSARWEGQSPQWASAFPLAGAGPASIALQASTASLSGGRYTAALLVSVPSANPSLIRVPVELTASIFIVGTTRVQAAVNAASFRPGLAPGGLFSIFGEGLAGEEGVAQAVPLPFALGGATVRVNGVVCPLWYVSDRQMNVQLPYSIAPGPATVTVNVEGRETSLAAVVSAVSPGVFTLDGTRPTPQPSGRRGDVLIAYVTGAGRVTPAIRDGAAPGLVAVSELPRPFGDVRVTIGGEPADILFAGLPPGVVGAVQVNFRIPTTVPVGNQPMVITVGGVVAQTVTLAVQ